MTGTVSIPYRKPIKAQNLALRRASTGDASYLLNSEMIFAVLLLIYIILNISQILCVSSITNFSDNGIYRLMTENFQGYDGSVESLGPIPTAFLRVSQALCGVILPCLGIYAIIMTIVHLSGSTIYLINPTFFDEVDRKHQEREGNQGGDGNPLKRILNNFRTVYNNHGLLGLLQAYLPNVKRICFKEALSGEDDTPTLGDFFKYNFLKYIVIFMLCILIMDNTFLDLFFKGGTIGAYFFRKAAYSYDYVVIMDNFIEAGKDYDPNYNTREIDEAHKQAVFDSIYIAIKSDKESGLGNSEGELFAFGQSVKAYVDNTIYAKMTAQFSFKNFTVHSEPQVNPGNTTSDPAAGLFYIPYAQFGLQKDKILCVIINAKEDTTSLNKAKTTYASCWVDGSGNQTTTSVPTQFDLSKSDTNLAALDKNKQLVGKAVITYTKVDGTKGTLGTNGLVPLTDGKIFSLSGIPTGDIYKIELQVSGSLYYGATSTAHVFKHAVWVNPNATLTPPTASSKPAENK